MIFQLQLQMASQKIEKLDFIKPTRLQMGLKYNIEMLDLSKPWFTHVMALVSGMVLKLGDGLVG